jgi:hypothetical protein
MSPRVSRVACFGILVVVASTAACGGEVRFIEDGDDGTGLDGDGPDDDDGGGGTDLGAACAILCALPCAGGGAPECVNQCVSGAPPGCEAEYADFISCAVADVGGIDPNTCEGLGLCLSEAQQLAMCTCEGTGQPCPL